MRRFADLQIPKQKKINEATFWEYLERIRKNPKTMLKKIPPEHWQAMTEWFWKVFERLNSLTSRFDFGLSDSSMSVANRGVVQMGKEGYDKVIAALKDAKRRRDFEEPEGLTKLFNKLYDKTDPAFLYWFMNLEDFLDGEMTEEELATHFSIPKKLRSGIVSRTAYSAEETLEASKLELQAATAKYLRLYAKLGELLQVDPGEVAALTRDQAQLEELAIVYLNEPGVLDNLIATSKQMVPLLVALKRSLSEELEAFDAYDMEQNERFDTMRDERELMDYGRRHNPSRGLR